MGIEFELKYAAAPETQAQIRAFLGEDFREYAMETTYYDTPGGALSARHWTLRRRLENGLSVCTLKTPAGDMGRGEWDCEADSIEEAIPILCKLSGQTELAALTAHGVTPTCGARFTRLAWSVEWNGSELEVSLDAGVLTGGGSALPLCEVEVELKSGAREDAVSFANMLAEKSPLTPEPRSKFRRALDLADEGQPRGTIKINSYREGRILWRN